MIRAWIAVAVCSVAFVGMTAAGARADNDAAASAASDFTDLFSFIGAAPLAPAERERLARATKAEANAHPDEVANADASVRKFLASLSKAQPLQRADLRERLRLTFEQLPQHDVLRGILDRTDPVVVFDKAGHRLVTEGTLVAWQHAGVWMAGLLSVPQPGADFISTQRAFVKAHYAALPEKERDVVAHIERNYPAMVAIIDRAPAAKRADFIASARPQALDRSTFGMRLADAMGQFYDVALHEEFIARLIGNMAVLNNGLLQAPMYTDMIRNMGVENQRTNAGLAHMGTAVVSP